MYTFSTFITKKERLEKAAFDERILVVFFFVRQFVLALILVQCSGLCCNFLRTTFLFFFIIYIESCAMFRIMLTSIRICRYRLFWSRGFYLFVFSFFLVFFPVVFVKFLPLLRTHLFSATSPLVFIHDFITKITARMLVSKFLKWHENMFISVKRLCNGVSPWYVTCQNKPRVCTRAPSICQTAHVS